MRIAAAIVGLAQAAALGAVLILLLQLGMGNAAGKIPGPVQLRVLARAAGGATKAAAAEKATFAGGCFWGVELGTCAAQLPCCPL